MPTRRIRSKIPTAFTGVVEMLLIFLIGVALTNTFGRMVGDQRHGWVLFAAMALLFVAGLAVDLWQRGAPQSAVLSSSSGRRLQAGGNMEGKEVRFGVGQSALFATVTTASSDGAVNAMHDSFMPLSGLVMMANMMLDEVIVGGPGSGLFGILLFAIVAVFAAGLMIGRTPEYLGKKIEDNEVKMTMLALLCVPAAILGISAVAAVLPVGLAGLSNAGPHGFSELLYAYTSGAATNGSAFAGLSANTPFYNLTLAVAMFAGRFLVIVPVLCIAGTLAAKRIVPASNGTLPTAQHAVRRTAGRHDRDRRWADVLSRAGARTCGGTLRDAGRTDNQRQTATTDGRDKPTAVRWNFAPPEMGIDPMIMAGSIALGSREAFTQRQLPGINLGRAFGTVQGVDVAPVQQMDAHAADKHATPPTSCSRNSRDRTRRWRPARSPDQVRDHLLRRADVVDRGGAERRVHRMRGVGIIDDMNLGAADRGGVARPIGAVLVQPQAGGINQYVAPSSVRRRPRPACATNAANSASNTALGRCALASANVERAISRAPR